MRRLAAVGTIALLGALGAVGMVGAGTASASTTTAQGAATRAATAHVTATPHVTGATRAAATKAPAPLVESVSPQGLGGLVSWAPDPASAAVTQYSAEAIPAPGTTPPPNCNTPVVVSVPGSNTAAVVGGLCTGVAYVARVRAVNAAGAGAWSAKSNPFAAMPAQVPGAPLITAVYGRSQSLDVSWSAPLSNGGEPLTGYSVTATAGASTVTVNAGASATSATVSGLTDGTSYQVTVVAQNALGPSTAATATGLPQEAYAPSAPGQFTAVPSGTGDIDLTWQAPVDDGGAAVSSYQVTYEEMVQNSKGQWVPAPGAQPVTVSASGSATSLTVTALTPANAFWSFSIAAVNSAGIGISAPAGQPVSPQTAITSQTEVLSAATMSALTSDSNGQLIWASPPSQVTGLTVGQVIVAAPGGAAPEGLLDTVESVTTNSSGAAVVGISQAPLSAAFTGLSVAGNVNPLTASGGHQAVFRPAIPGVRVLPRRLTGVSFSEDITLGIDFGIGPVSLSGEVDFTPTVGINIALTHGFLGVPNGAQISASASLGVKASLAATLQVQGSHQLKLGEVDGAPEDYQVGPVPVVVVPKVPVYLTASGQISTEVSASITIGAEASWTSQNPGTLSVKNLSTPLTVKGNPLLNASASASLGFSEQPQMDIYDATGPNFETDEDITATINPTPSSDEDFFSLGPSLSAKVGWDIDLLAFHVSLEETIAEQNFPSFIIHNPPGAELTVSPADPSVAVGGSKQFTATRSDGQNNPVTWSVLGGAGDTISSSGLLHTVAPGGRTITVVATDNTGASGETTVTVGAAFDPPQDVQANSSLDGRSATVSWQSPTNTGGSTISGYQLVTDPATKTVSVSGATSNATLTGLTPGVTYLLSVYATNSTGLRSGPATLSFTPSVSCSITWTGGSSNAWSNPANWDQSRLPNQNDLVCVNNGGTVNVTASTTIYGLTVQDGTLNTSSALTATDLLSVQGGVLEGSGRITVSPGATLALTQATLSGAHLVNQGQGTVGGGSYLQVEGATTLENAGTLALSDGAYLSWDGTSGGQLINDAGATISYAGGSQGAAIYPPLHNSGTVSASAETLTLTGAVSQTSTGSFTGGGTILVEGRISPSGSGAKLSDVTVTGSLVGPGTLTIPAGGSVQMNGGSYISTIDLVNKGQLGIDGNSVEVEAGAIVENAGTVTFADSANLSWDGTSGGQLVNDAGATIKYAGGIQGAYIEPPFNNYGTVSAGGGTLTIYSGNTTNASDTGTYSASSGATIDLAAGNRVLGSGLTVSGPGQFEVSGGVVALPGSVSVPNLTVTGSGQLSGPGTVTIPSSGVLTLGAGGYLTDGLTLVNMGTGTVQTGNYVSIEGGSTLQNAGTLTLADGADIAYPYDEGQLVNDAGATITYPGGTQGAYIGVTFDNYGTVSAAVGARGGTLYIEAGNSTNASDTGAYTASSGATIDMTGGNRVWGTGFTFTGPGQLEVSGGVVDVPGSVSVPNLALEGGQLSGPGKVTVPGSGVLALGSGGSLNGGLTLINKGTGTVQTGYHASVAGGSTLQNVGTLTLADGATIAYPNDPGQLVNGAAGTIKYAGGTQGAAIEVPFDNYGKVNASVGTRGGALSIYTGNTANASDTGSYSASKTATIDLSGGTRVLAPSVALTGPGTLEVGGGDVIDSGVGNGASLLLQGGTMEITPQATGKLASLVENSPGTLQFDVTSATPEAEPAQIVISGQAALGGTFVLQPTPSFVPATGTVLHLLDYTSKSGAFSSVVTPPGNVQYTLGTGATALTATATDLNISPQRRSPGA